MARNRRRAEKPAEEEEDVAQEEQVQPEDDDVQEPENQPQQFEGDLPSLKFNEELSWRPAKPIPTSTLITRLEKLSKELADYEQQGVDLDSLKDVAGHLAHRNYIGHKDKGVKAYAACCLVDLLRLFVPDAPFTDDQLQVGASVAHARACAPKRRALCLQEGHQS